MCRDCGFNVCWWSLEWVTVVEGLERIGGEDDDDRQIRDSG